MQGGSYSTCLDINETFRSYSFQCCYTSQLLFPSPRVRVRPVNCRCPGNNIGRFFEFNPKTNKTPIFLVDKLPLSSKDSCCRSHALTAPASIVRLRCDVGMFPSTSRSSRRPYVNHVSHCLRLRLQANWRPNLGNKKPDGSQARTLFKSSIAVLPAVDARCPDTTGGSTHQDPTPTLESGSTSSTVSRCLPFSVVMF